jgi:hypothetical protein
MDDSVAYTEQLMDFFAQRLATGQAVSVGEALRWAKNRYLGGVPVGGFGTYDEKAMIESTLYGLPMYGVSLPAREGPQIPERPPVSTSDLPTETLVFDLASSFQLETGSEDGDYYSVNGETQSNSGRPVQPRTGQLIPDKSGFGLTPHGAVLVNATAVVSDTFNPLVTRPITDITLAEPEFKAEGWFPADVWGVNQIGDEPRLVVVPAQFKGDENLGVLRLFETLEFRVYYTDTTSLDYTGPIVWEVDGQTVGTEADIWVTTEDASGVQEVVLAYTQDGLQWQSLNLTQVDQDQWEAHLLGLTGPLVYFVQIVDGAGNVTVTSNKGLFFEPKHPVYMPLVIRSG